MGNTIIPRRGGGYAKVNFENYSLPPSKITSKNLSAVRSDIGATTVGNYALFGGGENYVSGAFVMSSVVDAFDNDLSRSTPTALSVARHGVSATIAGDYAIFAGGSSSSYSSDTQAVVDAYNSSLSRTTPTEMTHDRDQFPATTIGNYAILAGGFWYAPNASGTGKVAATTAVVDAYSSNLTKTNLSELSQARNRFAATTVGDYALFAGGSPEMSNFGYSTVDAYNKNLVRSTPTELSQAKKNFDRKLWNTKMVAKAVEKGIITAEQYEKNHW